MINPEILKLSFLHLVQYLPQIWSNSHYLSYTDAQMADLRNDVLHVQINSRTLKICSKTTAGAEHILSSVCGLVGYVCLL